MDMIRDEVMQYVEIWNCHKIRKDRKRPNHVSGMPWWLYKHPPNGGIRYSRPIDANLSRELLEDCQHWGKNMLIFVQANADQISDPNEYLPATTLHWCQQKLKDLGYNLATLRTEDFAGGGRRTHVYAYHDLRLAILAHMRSGDLPLLEESERPEGGIAAAAERNGALYHLFWENREFRALVQDRGRVGEGFGGPELAIELGIADFFNIGDPEADDRGWSQRPLGT